MREGPGCDVVGHAVGQLGARFKQDRYQRPFFLFGGYHNIANFQFEAFHQARTVMIALGADRLRACGNDLPFNIVFAEQIEDRIHLCFCTAQDVRIVFVGLLFAEFLILSNQFLCISRTRFNGRKPCSDMMRHPIG